VFKGPAIITGNIKDAVNRGDAAPKMKRKWRNLEARLLRLK
jgi:hypothetical protein